jgi:recombination protein RecA
MNNSLEEILASINPKLRKKISLGNEIAKTEFQKTPSFGLNLALNGGLPYGRQVLVWGNKSSGKSSFCLQLIAQAQQEGKVCAWVDAEMSFSPEWAAILGVDVSNLIVSTARTMNDMVDVGTDLMKAGVDIIVVDSISALLPAIYFEKDSTDLKQLENTKQIGAEARDMTNAVKMLNYANNQVKPTLLILISQARNNIGAMYVSQQPTGGMATKFYSSTIIKLFSSESDNQAIKGKIYVGDKIIEEKVGRKVRWDVQFSKTSPAFQTGEYDFYFRGSDLGVDSVADLVDTSEMLGFIERGGAWYTVEGERYQGREKLILGVKENLDIQQALIEKVSNEQL